MWEEIGAVEISATLRVSVQEFRVGIDAVAVSATDNVAAATGDTLLYTQAIAA